MEERSQNFPPAAGSERAIMCRWVQVSFQQVPPSTVSHRIGVLYLSTSAPWNGTKRLPGTTELGDENLFCEALDDDYVIFKR